jgi:hypothetical protein
MTNTNVICIDQKSKHFPVSGETNYQMLKCLKIMYHLGYLPISWIKSDEPDYVAKKFKISLRKSLMIACIDIFIALIVIAYVPVWHLLNMGSSFDFTTLLQSDYYTFILQGSLTSAFSYFSFIFYPSLCWWIYIKIGL